MKGVGTALVLIFFATGCAVESLYERPRYDLVEQRDAFDDSLTLIQPAVPTRSITGSHILGFVWSIKYPKLIFLDVGTFGIVNVDSLAFNVDGTIIGSAETSSTITDYGETYSTRRFRIGIEDFMKVANGSNIKMKVGHINSYSVSAFGLESDVAHVDNKLAQFIAKLKEWKAL